MLNIFESFKKIRTNKKVKPVLNTNKSRAAQMIEILQPKPEEKIKGKIKTGKRKYKYPEFRISSHKKLFFLPDRFPLRYPLIEPYAYALIKKDPIKGVLTYNIIEPVMSDDERYIIDKIKQGLIQTINVSLTAIRHEKRLTSFLEERVQRVLDEYGFSLTPQQYLKIMYYIHRDFVGLNEIEPLLHDPYIEDLGVDGVNTPLYVVHQKFGSIKTNIIFSDTEKLREFVIKLAERCDRYISYAEPLLDGTLPDGTRVQATLASDITTRGPTFSIRKFRVEPFTPTDMVRLRTVSAELLAYLWYIIESRANILITGGTATGKTSFLNTISMFIPIEAKIVSIEDTKELSLPHEHWIPGVARASFTGTKVGEVTMFDLLKESFRQNPDYLIVGEVRGKEAYVMFQSMASGHASMSTIHAASLDDVVKRLESPPIELSPSLLETLDVVIVMTHATEKGKSARRVKEVVEIQEVDKNTGKANAVKAFSWSPVDDEIKYKGYSWVLNKISIKKGIPISKIYYEIKQRKAFIEWLVKHGVKSMKDVSKYITMYNKSKKKMLSMITEETGGF